MVKNIDFNGSLESSVYKFQHYDISYISLFVNGKQFPNEGLTLGMDLEKTSVMGYRTPFNASGIHNSNTGLHIIHDIYIYINGYFLLLFDLTSNKGRVGGSYVPPREGQYKNRIEIQ